MNKKAVSTLELAVYTVLAALVALWLFNLIPLLTPSTENDDNDELYVFYYKQLVDNLKNLKDNIQITTQYLPNKDFILISFSDNITKLKESDLSDMCGKIGITGEILKPNSCQGNSCLCLCEIDNFGYLGGDLVVNCESENVICNQVTQNVVGDSSCGYFLYYNSNEDLQELTLLKQQNIVIIQPKGQNVVSGGGSSSGGGAGSVF